jgi:hypothetical protein
VSRAIKPQALGVKAMKKISSVAAMTALLLLPSNVANAVCTPRDLSGVWRAYFFQGGVNGTTDTGLCLFYITPSGHFSSESNCEGVGITSGMLSMSHQCRLSGQYVIHNPYLGRETVTLSGAMEGTKTHIVGNIHSNNAAHSSGIVDAIKR